MSFHIRPYQTKDHNDVYTICLKTGDAGSDASNLYKDPNLLGHIYAGPYINLEPESAFMLEDEIGICGYIIGALDTQSFFNKVKLNWLPALQNNIQNRLKIQSLGRKMKNAFIYFSILKSLNYFLITHPIYI
jgi:hypothetical protein